MGLADLALYEGRASDTIQILKKGITASRIRMSMALPLNSPLSAKAYLLQGHAAEASAAAAKALSSSSDDSILFSAARLYLGTGDVKESLMLARRLGTKLEPDPEAYAKIIEGEVELEQKKPQEALQFFQQARQIADTWVGLFDSG
jgi:outer membrane PBP1 activator LpoA protein